MVVAVFADAHAHAEALDAVIGAAEASGAQELWSLGDMIGRGPDPEHVVTRTRERCAVALMGNHDYGATGSAEPTRFGAPGSPAVRSIKLARDRLSGAEIAWMRSRKPAARRGEVQLWHGGPRNAVSRAHRPRGGTAGRWPGADRIRRVARGTRSDAIAAVGRLLPGRAALVVHAWESALRHSLSGRALIGAPVPEIREVSEDLETWRREAAEATVEEGVELARAAGLDARGEAVESGSTAWRVLAATAETRDAAVVVAGSQGHGGVASVLLGSVSAGLVHHAERPTLIVRAPAP